MSHKAFYRKYRPINFSEVLGQEDIVKILKNSINKGTFAHAYLFSGTKGTGKTSVAKIFARTINCENNKEGESCTECTTCKLLKETKEHVDIIEIDGASNNGVDEIRSIRNNVSILPMNLKYKVYIIDEVHMLTNSAFNALLKTLEEPPKHIVFLFATTESHKVPSTIVSRCQWFEFQKINITSLELVLQNVAKKENIKFEEQAIQEIASLSDGSLRDAINNLEKVFNFSNELTLKGVNEIFQRGSKKEKIKFLINLCNHNPEQLFIIWNKFQNYLPNSKKIIIDLIYLMQDITLYQITSSIKTLKNLTKEETLIFSDVKIEDTKLILNTFDELLNLQLPEEAISALCITRLLGLMSKISQYNLTLNPVLDATYLNQEKIKLESTTQVLKPRPIIKSPPVLEVASKDIDQESINQIGRQLLNDVINIVVQADKNVRNEVKKSWSKINELIEQKRFRNIGKIYLNTVIKAACPKGIIIVSDNIIQATIINKKFLLQEYRNFLNELLNEEYFVIALDKKQWKLIGSTYQQQEKTNTLPKPTIIVIPNVEKQDYLEEKDKTLRFLQNIFPEVEEI